jgi:hypothetical protein
MKEIKIELPAAAITALFHGKEIHYGLSPELRIIIKPPFKGVFLTHEELERMKRAQQDKALDLFKKVTQTFFFKPFPDDKKEEEDGG